MPSIFSLFSLALSNTCITSLPLLPSSSTPPPLQSTEPPSLIPYQQPLQVVSSLLFLNGAVCRSSPKGRRMVVLGLPRLLHNQFINSETEIWFTDCITRLPHCSRNTSTGIDEIVMSGLIEGLPDAVALRCLARVPFIHHPTLELVSRSWRTAIRSPELFKARREVCSSETFLCVCAFDPENLWQLYDPLRDLWITLPVLPSKVSHLAKFGAVSAAGKLFVLGGGSDAVDPLTGDQDGSFATNEVWSYDPVKWQWAPCAPMIVPRAMFACCVLDGKIIVAGGFTTCRKSISQAEMYDPEKDIWVSIPDLHHTHNSACSGVVIGGKMHVMHKGLSTVQILDNMKLSWRVQDYGWLQGPMAVIRGVLYVMSHGHIYRQERETSKVVVSASEFRSRIGFAMVGLEDEIYVIGGVIGPEARWNWEIKQMSDVDVLTIGSERPIWRKGAQMTQCRGTIMGCSQLRF